MPIDEVTHPVKSLFGRAVRVVLIAILFVIAAGLIAPFITMARYTGEIREALETALGRPVQFQKLHLTVFSGPGFALDNVTIGEDPRFGLEPFAYVPTLEARVRLDKLLLGRIQFSSLRLIDPALNLVKKGDGTWNVVSLIERLSSPRRVPLNLFPAVEVSGGRLNFKLGMRKTTVYISETDLSIYPERSGKLYVQFSGSPARTDRAGNGFGHFRGTANWYLAPKGPSANQLEADLTLDRSNLGEMTTLFEGHEAGVDGTVSSHMRIEGPATGLRIVGDLRLEDVHRWDLLPASGEDWHIRYGGGIDLLAHRLSIATIPPSRSNGPAPVNVQLQVDDFLRTNNWTIATRFTKAPAQNLLPLASRMGLSLPDNLSLTGTLDGTVSDSEQGGLSGKVTMENLATTVPGASPLTAGTAAIDISSGHLHLADTTFQTSEGSRLGASGDYFPDTREVAATLHLTNAPLNTLKSETAAWFGENAVLGLITGGQVNGRISYTHTASDPALWSGQVLFSGATLIPQGVATPLRHSTGRLTFHGPDFQIDNLSATLADHVLKASYRYSADARPAERLRLQVPAIDLTEIQDFLRPSVGEPNLWTRLHFTRRRTPVWLATRNLEGSLDVAQFSAGGVLIGSIQSRFAWKGHTIRVTSLQSDLPQGSLQGHGIIELAGDAPSYRFTSSVTGYPFKGGLLDAAGQIESSGLGTDTLRNVQATGTFSGTNIALSPQDTFDHLAGIFNFTLADGWPNIHLTQVDASGNDERWTGEAASGSDGKLVFDFQNEGQQRQIVTPLTPENASPSPQSALRNAPSWGALR